MPMTDLLSTLGDNPYFSAGFGLFGLGLGAAVLRKGASAGVVLFRRNFMMTLEVPCRDKSYQWVLLWVTQKAARRTQHLSVETTFEQMDTGRVNTTYHFLPSIGVHLIEYHGKYIQVTRTREQQSLDLHAGVPWENVVLTTFGTNKSIFTNILEEARQMALKTLEGRTIVYTALGSEWRPFGHPQKPRPLKSVVLDDGISERILKDVQKFIAKPYWYIERGIPYRRGYLLHGPPGCGKTSFIKALAGELQYGVCLLNLSERGLTDDRLNYLMSAAPQNTIILLEDVDAAFGGRHESKQVATAYDGLSRVTLSGLLNALDGAASSEARILFMTTNYIERLDAALIRPGRVDSKEYFGHCSQSQIERMYNRFFLENNDSEKYAKEFAETVFKTGKPASAAQIQGYFMLFEDSSPSELIKNHNLIWEA
ncbi:mitochondrial chaperone BCS1 [Metopolophium dirhodum]|uniref:mitochondrial chaperone BCS1 n=1 Tax=Metopolophium dirhodum TaxID=44670 RepID=UPI0029904675|nr:mitochondrial chaperone BCS1 [Metopolophium dirhodum]